MKTSSLPLLLLLAACAHTARYDVYATGYTGGVPTSIPAATPVALVANPHAGSPLLERELLAGLRAALADAGFPEVPLDRAPIAVMISYGSGQRSETQSTANVVPGTTTTLTDSAGRTIGTASTGPTIQWVPETTTRTDRWLTVTAIDAAVWRATGAMRPVWIGEANGYGLNLDLRRSLQLMVGPAAGMFGTNAPQARVRMREGTRSAMAVSAARTAPPTPAPAH